MDKQWLEICEKVAARGYARFGDACALQRHQASSRFLSLIFTLLASLTMASPVSAEAGKPQLPSLLLSEATADVATTTQKLTYFIDRDDRLTPSEVWSGALYAEMQPVSKSEPNFGFQKHSIWLRLPIANDSSSEAERVLLMKTNYVSEIDVWLKRQDGPERLLSQRRGSPFSSRPIAFHQLATSFTLQPEEQSDIWIRYRTDGLTSMPVEIHSDLGFATRAAGEMASNFAFYGVMLMLLLASICAFAITRAAIFLWYGAYAAFVTTYIFHRDGYAFQFIWPEYPALNSVVSIPLSAALVILAAQFTRVFLATVDTMRILDKVLLTVIALHILAVASSLLLDLELIRQVMTLSIPVSAMIFLASGLAALRRKGMSAIAFVLGWFGIVAASIVTFTAHWLDIEVTRAATLDTIRAAMVFDAVMMGVACVSVIVQWRRERESLMVEKLASAERNMQLRTRLEMIEQNNQMVEDMLDQSNRKVADTTHDLRQPLFALRAAILNLSARPGHNDSDLESIEASLGYMEKLVEQNLDQATEAAPMDASQEEPIPVQRVLDAVGAIFREEAAAADIELRIIPSCQMISGDTAEILRMLSNLISNALAYSGADKILVASRLRRGGLRFDVIDNGSGIAPARIEQLKERSARDQSAEQIRPEGKGLGLSIVQELAGKLGSQLEIVSRRGRGSRFTFVIKKSGNAASASSATAS
ncbi:MAG: sensor histidine kinase [Pseudomonadota bacterium]